MNLVTASEMQEMDRQTIESFGIPGRVLMENAGRAATHILMEHFANLQTKRIGVVAGRGNNGGDGFVIARYLKQKGVHVHVFLLTEAKRIQGDAAANFKLLKPLAIPVTEIPDENLFLKNKPKMTDLDVVVDAILGTGLKSDVKGYFKTVIDFINNLKKPVFAVDIPSGLNSDTGQPCGTCIRAKVTATFGFAKIGHIIYPGADFTGKLEIVEIGIPPYIVENVSPRQYLITEDRIRSFLPVRSSDAHKGRTGHLLILAGSPGKTGAASMTSLSALRVGAGLVTLGIAESLNATLESQMLEAMTEPLKESQYGIIGDSAFDAVRELMTGKKCLAIGPGIGQADETKELMQRIIYESDIPIVIDADGLNNLAGRVQILNKAQAPIILTPHPGEMARLIDAGVHQVQQDRIACAREFATKYNVHLVLKGARTVIAPPDGRVYLNPTGNSGMASGGMGDVLTGLIAGLITQGVPADAAAQAGAYIHGAAADSLLEAIGPYGYLAGDVINAIPREIKKIMNCL